MKRRDLINRLENAGLKFERHDTDHDIYSKDGQIEMIPRHREINERLANAILKRWRA